MKKEINYNNIVLDRKSPEPLHIQLKNALLKELRTIPTNRKIVLMSERELTDMLKISRPTTHRAYQELINTGLAHRLPDKSLELKSDARSKIAGSYRVIGILLPMDFPSYVDNNGQRSLPYLKGLLGRASELNISCMILQPPAPDASDEEIDAFLEEHIHRLYGLIHLGAMLHHGTKGRVLNKIMECKEIPQVCVSGFCEYPHIGSAIPDVEPAMHEICNILQRKKVKSLALISQPTNDEESPFIYLSQFREETMAAIARSYGIEVVCTIPVNDHAKAADLMLSRKVGAFFCHNTRTAEKIMQLANVIGKNIPEDFLIAGYDRDSFDPGLTRIDPMAEEVARKAIDLIVEHFECGVNKSNRIAKITAKLIDGKTL
ncbi:MAG: hypothetical protein E7043_09775 [Lentisphaerae bacterium]|nr:hypothetical protein [Lentisphaerota bacterium]